MNDVNLRQIEKHLKLRVKTGCKTCRVKCDETKPECTRCTKTGRKCDGYEHTKRSRDNSPAVAASHRNSSFLVVPQTSQQISISRSPSWSLGSDVLENRSFHYFQAHTLPRWTEFFESELWSQKVLQLSHVEPAIKHGILALSTMHEKFEGTSAMLDTKMSDFAFVQYMQAVRHSNDLLIAHQKGHLKLENVLIACIIFTCYENLAGNYKAANMHLHNGLQILKQHNHGSRSQITASQESVGNILHRFDLQAMTFSSKAAPYKYTLENLPECPDIRDAYTRNSEARNDLVELLRCLLWVSGIVDNGLHILQHTKYQEVQSRLMKSFEEWERAFSKYQMSLPKHELGDSKIYAGNTLLRIYAIMIRIAIASNAWSAPETAWDNFVDSFKTMVDLADTLPHLSQDHSSPSSRSSLSPSPGPTSPVKNRPIAPNPNVTPSPSPPGPLTSLFRSDPTSSSYRLESPRPTFDRAPSSFSPSFELSPIVPMFLVACRCRDPIVRRRAVALLLNSRRREGVWDSLGAGLVAAQWLKQEEGLEEVELPPDNWLPLTPSCQGCNDIPESRRLREVNIAADVTKEFVEFIYKRTNGEEWVELRDPYEIGFRIGFVGKMLSAST